MNRYKWLLLIMFVLNAFIIYKYTKETHQLQRQNKICQTNYNTLLETIKKTTLARISSEDLYLEKNQVAYFNNKSYHTAESGKFTKQLILIIPEKSCNICYDEVYGYVKYAHDSLNIKVNIFTSKSRYRETKNMMAQFEIPGHLYYFSTDFPTKQHAIEFSSYFVYIDQKKKEKKYLSHLLNIIH